jgi:hypothetical protein
MTRLHLFEFEDFEWFPDTIRTGGTDYLRHFLIKTELYKPCASLIDKVMKLHHENHLVDLCSGSGGSIEQMYDELKKHSNDDLHITLTDKFPNIKAYEFIKQRTDGNIDYKTHAIDVFNVPENMQGIRVMFSAIHHFKPEQVKLILENTMKSNKPICIFDGGEKTIVAILGILILHPIAFLLFTPFFKPVKTSRYIFTYIVPLIPLYTIWDGVVSILRMYTPADFKKITHSLNNNNYQWEMGKTTNRFGIKATYLIGYPKP